MGDAAGHLAQSTQAFLLRFLEKNDIATAEAGRGRFRSWMLACLGNFQSNEKDAEMAWKAGGRVCHVSIDANEAEGLAVGPASAFVDDGSVNPVLFDRHWAVRVVDRALEAMERQCKNEKAREFLALILPLLALPDTDVGENAHFAAKLEIDEGTFKTRLSRERKAFWSCVRVEIAETLEDPNDTDDEIKHLIAVLGAIWRT